jgi:signal peptidase I
VLQFFLPGLGNLYCGHPYRGIVVFLLYQAIAVSALIAAVWLPRTWNLLLPVGAILMALTLAVVDGVRGARAAEAEFRLRRYNRWYVYLVLYIGIAVVQPIVVGLPLTNVLLTGLTPTPSMEPTLLVGDRYLTSVIAYRFSNPARDDVVLFSPPHRPELRFVFRVVGLPGETIEIREKSVYINGQRLDEPYAQFVLPSRREIPGDMGDGTILADNAYFLLGDNRDNSADSRFFGPVPRSQIHGKVRMIYFSWDEDQQRIRWERLGDVVD